MPVNLVDNLVCAMGNSWGELSTHQIVWINGWISEIKSEQTCRFTWKPKRKKTAVQERGFHYNSDKITMVTTDLTR